jgi:hypothetical protein
MDWHCQESEQRNGANHPDNKPLHYPERIVPTFAISGILNTIDLFPTPYSS